MGYNKFVYDGVTKFDLTGDTVTPQTLAKGVTAHNAKGDPIVGTLVPEGGSGGGIIDVTELPTENIDENAVYRVTETIQTEKTEIYILASGVVTIQQYLTSLGVPTKANMYVVDELPADMLPTDIQTFTQLHFYILKSNGVAYAYVPAMGGVITGGLFGFQSTNYDKGFTENIYDEHDAGIYTTIETFKEFTRYFARKNSEWNELTAYRNVTLPNGFDYVEFLQGEYTVGDSIEVISPIQNIDIADKVLNNKVIPSQINVDVYPSGNVISGYIGERVPQKAFLIGDHIYADTIKDGAFMSCSRIKEVHFPDTIRTIGRYAFYGCTSLASTSLPIYVRSLGNSAFYGCTSLALTDIPATVKSVDYYAFAYCTKFTTITFKGFVNEIDSSAFLGCTGLTTINVPWAEGDVANAPWGAANATINYNYTEG
jgi:hypothetical protein